MSDLWSLPAFRDLCQLAWPFKYNWERPHSDVSEILPHVPLGPWTCACCLVKCSLTRSSTAEGMSAFLQTSALVSGPNGCIKANLTSNDWGKEGTENLDLFHILCHQVPSLPSNGSKFSHVFLPVCVLVISFPVAFDSSCQIHLQVFVGFLYPILAKLNRMSALLDYLSLL